MWKKLKLSNDEVIRNRAGQLSDRVIALLDTIPPEKQKGAAIFSRYDTESGTSILYISPAAYEVIGDLFNEFKLVECEPPNRDGTSLLVGDSEALK